MTDMDTLPISSAANDACLAAPAFMTHHRFTSHHRMDLFLKNYASFARAFISLWYGSPDCVFAGTEQPHSLAAI